MTEKPLIENVFEFAQHEHTLDFNAVDVSNHLALEINYRPPLGKIKECLAELKKLDRIVIAKLTGKDETEVLWYCERKKEKIEKVIAMYTPKEKEYRFKNEHNSLYGNLGDFA